MPVEDFPLEMRIDLEIRDVLKLYKTTAWDIMEQDILGGVERHKLCLSYERRYDVKKADALKGWLDVMRFRCLRPEPSEAEMESEWALMRLIREYEIVALNVMEERVDDLKKHLWYASEWAGRDIGRSAALDDWIRKYTWYPDNRELLEIEYAYKKGEFRQDELDLYEFVRKHPEEIMEYQQALRSKIRNAGEISVIDATRLLFLKKQSVNPQRDIIVQRDLIQKEFESRQANDEETRTRIVLDFKQNVAPYWRDKKVKIIDYIITVQADKLLAMLQKPVERKLEYACA
ncbi:MAG: hypothetical protein QXR48_04765 [Candidatus Woesearchaeota archaeon]